MSRIILEENTDTMLRLRKNNLNYNLFIHKKIYTNPIKNFFLRISHLSWVMP